MKIRWDLSLHLVKILASLLKAKNLPRWWKASLILFGKTQSLSTFKVSAVTNFSAISRSKDINTPPPVLKIKSWSGRRDSNPQLFPWQGNVQPLHHSRDVLIIWQVIFLSNDLAIYLSHIKLNPFKQFFFISSSTYTDITYSMRKASSRMPAHNKNRLAKLG